MDAAARDGAGLRARTLGGMRWLVLTALATAVLRIGVIAVYARLLAPADFGIMAVAGIFIEIGRFVAASGIVRTLIQRRTISDEEIQTAFTANFLASIAVALLICLFSVPISRFFGMAELPPVLWACALIFPLLAVSAVSSVLLERAHDFRKIATSDVLTYVAASLAVGIPMAALGAGPWALLAAQLVAALLRSVLLLRAQPHRLRLFFRRDLYADMMRHGAGFSLQRAANIVALKGDYLVAGSMLGPAALGLYERAYVLMNVSNALVGKNLSTVLFPAFSRMRDDVPRQRAAFLRCMALASLIFLPASLVAMVLGPEIVRILLGKGWDAAVLPFQILAAGMFFRNAYKIAGAVTDSNAWMYLGSLAHCAYAAAVVGGAWLLVGHGIAGVAASTLVAVILVFLMLSFLACRSCGARPGEMLGALLPGLALALVCGACCWAAAALLRQAQPSPFLVAVGGALAAALPLLPLLWLARFRRERLGHRGRELLETVGWRPK